MKRKQVAGLAPLTEAATLLTTVVWSTWLLDIHHDNAQGHQDTPDALLVLLPRLSWAMRTLALAACTWSLCAAEAVPKSMQLLSRRERDGGLVVCCILPPLVLGSRFLVEAITDRTSFPASTLMYTWVSTSASISALLKIVLFGSSGFIPTLFIDGFAAPVAFALLGFESDLRFVLATLARLTIAAAFRLGRLALPRSFTVGEALIVAQTIGLGVFDLILVTLVKFNINGTGDVQALPDRFSGAWHLYSSFIDRPDHQLALQVGIVGAIILCIILSPLLSTYGSPSPHVISPSLPAAPSLQFLSAIVAVLAGIVYPWSCFLLDTWDPLAWLASFVLADATRWQILLYWLVCLGVCVPAFAILSTTLALRQIVARKLFHLLVVVLFLPAYWLAPEVLSLSYGVAFAVFCLVECVRAVALPPFGQAIATFVRPFIDHREGGRVILTHTYLLVGCALPLWLTPSPVAAHALAANAGVLALGVGDAMGAVIGSTYGTRKVFGSKSVQGSTAVLVTMAIASFALHDYHWRAIHDGALLQMSLLALGLVLTTALEAATAQIDNLVLSLFLYAIANLVSCHA